MWGDGTLQRLEKFCKSVRCTPKEREELLWRWKAQYRMEREAYLDTLTAEITLFNAEQSLVSARQTRAASVVALYRALGGGVTASSVTEDKKSEIHHGVDHGN